MTRTFSKTISTGSKVPGGRTNTAVHLFSDSISTGKGNRKRGKLVDIFASGWWDDPTLIDQAMLLLPKPKTEVKRILQRIGQGSGIGNWMWGNTLLGKDAKRRELETALRDLISTHISQASPKTGAAGR